MNESQRALEEQFDRILAEYGPSISRLAFSYESIAGVREELVQEIAMAIWKALPHFRGECSERTFVFRIAHNRGLSHASRRRPLMNRWAIWPTRSIRLTHNRILSSARCVQMSAPGSLLQFRSCR